MLGFQLAVRDLSVEREAGCVWKVTVSAGGYTQLGRATWLSSASANDKWIDWGDGTVSTNINTYTVHTYTSAGTYTVKLSNAATWFSVPHPGLWDTSMTDFISWGDNITNAEETFRHCTSLALTSLPEWPSGLTNATGIFMGCTSLALTSLPEWPSGLTNVTGMFQDCTSLALTSLPEWPSGLTDAHYMFFGCTSLAAKIPAWPSGLTNTSYMFKNCTSLTGAWTEDADSLMPTTITSHDDTVTGASDSVRKLFYPSWGGTRDQYAPNTAIELTFSEETTIYIRWYPLTVGATCVFDWGDGHTFSHTHTGSSVTDAEYIYYKYAAGTYVLQIGDVISQFNFMQPESTSSILSPNTYVTKVLRWGNSFTRAHSVFYRCTNLKGNIPKWGPSLKSVESCFSYCTALEGAWTDDTTELMPSTITTKNNCFIGASAAIRALFTSAWGGSKS